MNDPQLSPGHWSQGVKPVQQLPTTVPKSPAFALKNRVRIPVEVPQVVSSRLSVVVDIMLQLNCEMCGSLIEERKNIRKTKMGVEIGNISFSYHI